MVDPVAMDAISASGMPFFGSDESLVMFNFRDRRVYCFLMREISFTELLSYIEHDVDQLSVSLILFLFFLLRTAVTNASVVLWRFRKRCSRNCAPDALVIAT